MVRMQTGAAFWKAVQSYLKKLKMELLYDPVIPLLGIYSKKANIVIQKDICTPAFIIVLLAIAKI